MARSTSRSSVRVEATLRLGEDFGGGGCPDSFRFGLEARAIFARYGAKRLRLEVGPFLRLRRCQNTAGGIMGPWASGCFDATTRYRPRT